MYSIKQTVHNFQTKTTQLYETDQKYTIENVIKFGILTMLIIINLTVIMILVGINYLWDYSIKESSIPLISTLFLGLSITFSIIIANFSRKMHKNSQFKSNEIKNINSELIKAERLSAIGELSSRIAHDLRNPLSVIKNTLEVLHLDLEEKRDEEIENKFERINRAVARIDHQIENVLDFVREKPLKLEKISLRSVIDSAIDRIPVTPKIELPQNDIEIFCDKTRLEVAFTNIIQNAIDSVDNDVQIKIRFIDSNSEVTIEFENSGPAIPQEILPKIFTPLFTTKKSGTGLGLVTTKNIVKQHKGTTSVKNNPVTFTICLPKNSN